MKACRPLLGTYVEIRVEDPDSARVEGAICAAFAVIAQVQTLMSVHEPASDLSAVNRQAHRQAVTVHPWTYEVLALALEVHQASEGAFDCCVARRLAAWGLLPEFLGGGEGTEQSMAHLQLLGDGRVGAAQPLGLDLGGIAKGYAVDKAAEALQAAGIGAAVINAGGDLRVLGDLEEAIHVRSATHPDRLQLLGMLQDGAIATSGSYFSTAAAAQPEVSALVDPRSGRAVVSEHSYSVIAPCCAVADALTKVLAVTGRSDHPCFAAYQAQPLIL